MTEITATVVPAQSTARDGRVRRAAAVVSTVAVNAVAAVLVPLFRRTAR
ncbi:hypothetical protein [Pseudonocardia acaciae]|nr:hypothetical protein [Pseudonocardia acaciae]